MPSVAYRFTRSQRPRGFLSNQQVGTDAVNALIRWRAGHASRSFVTISEEPTYLAARLSWAAPDDGGGRLLDVSCEDAGVERELEP